MNFAKKCRELRMKKAATQEQMAAALNLSSQAISKWETGQTLPDITLLPEISVYFGVTIDELFDMTDEKHFDRIQNMVLLQETIDEHDFEYAQNFLISQLAKPEAAEQALVLLPAVYNRKAAEYRGKAEYYAKEALARFPDNHDHHANLSEAQQGVCGDWNLDNQAERIRFYKEFLSKNPGSAEGWNWYFTSLLAVGRCREAEEALERMEALATGKAGENGADPTERAQKAARMKVFRIRLLWEQGAHEEALAALENVTTEYADDWLVQNLAADVYAKAGEYDEAIRCYEQVMLVQPRPRYTDAPMAIAQICEITGDTACAVQAWQSYIQILKEDWNTTEGMYIDRANKKIQELGGK